MREFVDRQSIVRTIWGSPDLILLIFAGAAAEFALNRAVDWLFFTGHLPRDPIGRLFATVRYAQELVFGTEEAARRTLDRIHAIHGAVERRRGQPLMVKLLQPVLTGKMMSKPAIVLLALPLATGGLILPTGGGY
jgi:hypothetical protein